MRICFGQLKRLACTLLLIGLLTGLLSGCSGMGDWSVTGLPGGYEVWRVHADGIVLCLPKEDVPGVATTVVDKCVISIAYTDEVICVEQVDPPEDIHEKLDTSDPNYYIVVVEDGTCYGPLDPQGFNDQIDELGVSKDLQWVDPEALSH